MTPRLFLENDYTTAYVKLLSSLLNDGYAKSPRGQKVNYFQNAVFHVDFPGTTFSCASRPFNFGYLNKELSLYFSGDCSASEFEKASKFWGKLANPDGTINSNYGYLVFHKQIQTKFGNVKNQWTYAKNQLLSDMDTRQALMFVSSPHVQFEGNKDFICTLSYVFSINEDTLSLEVNRRSQDVILGITYDYPWEFLLLEKMYNELKPAYPSLKRGTYTMFCNNVHLYERNFELVKKMLNDYAAGEYKSVDINDGVDRSILDGYVLNKDFGNWI